MAGLPSDKPLHALHANPRGKPLYCVPFKAPKALIDALVAQQSTATIHWEAPGSKPCTLTVGDATWNAQCLDEPQPCDVLLAPKGFPGPSTHTGLCHLGRVQCKLQVERTLDDHTAQRFKSRQEQEEQRGRERQTKVLGSSKGQRTPTPPPAARRQTPTPPPAARRQTPTPSPSVVRAATPSMGGLRGTTPPPPGAALVLGRGPPRATTPPPVFVRATTPPPLAAKSAAKPAAAAATTPVKSKAQPSTPFATTSAMRAAAKAGNVRKLVALVLHDRPLPMKGIQTYVKRVVEDTASTMPTHEQLRVALADIAELRNPGRYHLKPDVERGLREEAPRPTPPPAGVRKQKTRTTPDLPIVKNGRTRTTPDLATPSFTSTGRGAGKHAAVAAHLASWAREDSTEPISSDSDQPTSAKRPRRAAGALHDLGDDSDDALPGQRQQRAGSEPPAVLQPSGVAAGASPPLPSLVPVARGSPPVPAAPLPPVVLELARSFDRPLAAQVAAAVGGRLEAEAPGEVTTAGQFEALRKGYGAVHYAYMDLQQRLVKLRSALRSLQDAADAASDDAARCVIPGRGDRRREVPLDRTALLQEYTRVWQARREQAEAWDGAVKRLHAQLESMRRVLDEYVAKTRS